MGFYFTTNKKVFKKVHKIITSKKYKKTAKDAGATSSAFSKAAHDRPPRKAMFVMGVFDGLASTLVHECVHLVDFVARHVGLTHHDDDNNEAWAYLTDFVFEMSVKVLLAERKKK